MQTVYRCISSYSRSYFTMLFTGYICFISISLVYFSLSVYRYLASDYTLSSLSLICPISDLVHLMPVSQMTYLKGVVAPHEVEVLRLVVLSSKLVDDGPQTLVFAVRLATLVAHDLMHPPHIVLRLLRTCRQDARVDNHANSLPSPNNKSTTLKPFWGKYISEYFCL